MNTISNHSARLLSAAMKCLLPFMAAGALSSRGTQSISLKHSEPVNRHPHKVSQLHHLRLTWLNLGEAIKQFVNREHLIIVVVRGSDSSFFIFGLVQFASVAHRLPASGPVDENAEHRFPGR